MSIVKPAPSRYYDKLVENPVKLVNALSFYRKEIYLSTK